MKQMQFYVIIIVQPVDTKKPEMLPVNTEGYKGKANSPFLRINAINLQCGTKNGQKT